jgi:hypothetical protein
MSNTLRLPDDNITCNVNRKTRFEKSTFLFLLLQGISLQIWKVLIYLTQEQYLIPCKSKNKKVLFSNLVFLLTLQVILSSGSLSVLDILMIGQVLMPSVLWLGLGLRLATPISTICQLYRDGQFYW